MSKRIWVIPVLIVAINALSVIVRWSSLPELLPAHFDLQGNAGGSMQRNVLVLYPIIGAAICLAAYVFSLLKEKLMKALVVLSSGIALILFLSTLVTLTSGKVPFFMLAEPVVLLGTVAAAVICVVRESRG